MHCLKKVDLEAKLIVLIPLTFSTVGVLQLCSYQSGMSHSPCMLFTKGITVDSVTRERFFERLL